MNNRPITYVKAQVIAPATGVSYHAKIQQHISFLIQEPDYRNKHALVAIRKDDLERLFPDGAPSQFYILGNGTINYVGLRAGYEREKEEAFGTIVALNQKVLESIFADNPEYLMELQETGIARPWLRMTILMNSDDFVQNNALSERLTIIDHSSFLGQGIDMKYAPELNGWVSDEDDRPEEVVDVRPKIHLKDIPLKTRTNRILVRNAIRQHLTVLEDAYKASPHHAEGDQHLSFNDWMTQIQGVNMKIILDLEGIDNLPDEEYVQAFMTFKKAEAQAIHSQQLKDGKTQLHLFDWVKENFGVEFNDLGRDEALADLIGIELEPEPDLAADEDQSAVFLITFDGTIVEDQFPAIGPASPFALDTIRALISNGHKVFIMSGRIAESRQEMMKFLDHADCLPLGICEAMFADGQIHHEQVYFFVEEDKNSFEVVEIDYLIDHRLFGIATVQISGNQAPATVYWGDLVNSFHEYGYLTDNDVQSIMESLSEEAGFEGVAGNIPLPNYSGQELADNAPRREEDQVIHQEELVRSQPDETDSDQLHRLASEVIEETAPEADTNTDHMAQLAAEVERETDRDFPKDILSEEPPKQ